MTAQSTIAENGEFSFFRKRPDGAVDPVGEAGWFLQREREKRRISLEDAGAVINIHPAHLAAIENGDLAGLPQRADALAMIASYASFLDFEAEPLVMHFARFLPRPAKLGQPKPAADPKRPAPLSSAKILMFPFMDKMKSVTSGAGGIVASCLGAVMLFGAMGWYFMPSTPGNGQNTGVSVASVKEQPLTDDMMPANTEVTNEADAAANSLSGLDKLIAENTKDANINTASIPAKPAGEVPQVDKTKIAATGGRIYGSENKNTHLVLTAKSNVWIRIEDARGNVVMTRTLMKGDSYRVPDRKGLVVISRDGGLIEYAVDGANKGSLGKSGEILVGRSLDYEKLLGLKG